MTDPTPDSLVPPIPVTLLSGALGAGKTTLLRELLDARHGLKIAVIENEFAASGIDDQLLGDTPVTVVALADGCICCSIGGDLTRALVVLLERLDAGELDFERLVIECSGMADPGPIAQAFFAEEQLRDRYQLDGILTLVDAVHAERQLDRPLAQAQVGFADKLLVTKRDQIDDTQLEALCARLARINRRAPIVLADHGKVPLTELIELRGFHLEGDPDALVAASLIPPTTLFTPSPTPHRHDDAISTLVLESIYPLDIDALSEFMNELLEEHGNRLLRYKGVLDIEGEPRRLVFQGVFRLYGFDWDREWGNEPRKSVVVFIGEHLPEERIRQGFARATERRIG